MGRLAAPRPTTALHMLLGCAALLVLLMFQNARDLSLCTDTLDCLQGVAVLAERGIQPGVTIDIVSTGSRARPGLQAAQERTFATHVSVRHFFRVDERNDTEADCSERMTNETLYQIVDHCRRRSSWLNEHYPELFRMRKNYAGYGYLKDKSNPTGWMCAQKRPIDGLVSALRSTESLPDYLIILDDDTWLNMNHVVPFLLREYPIHTPFVIAGCMMRWNVIMHNFTIPFGGFGTFYNRAALIRFTKPIHCPSDDEFSRHVCQTVNANRVGEGPLFRNGMSVVDLMYAYVQRQPYLDVANWDEVGFCMHSDWALSYFINFYNIPIHAVHPKMIKVPHDRLRGYNDSALYIGRQNARAVANLKECKHSSDDNCDENAHICHYVTAGKMDALHGQAASIAA